MILNMNTARKFGGSVVPVITPVTAEGRLDEPALDRLLDAMLASRTAGVFVMGTTGEGSAIPAPDRQRIVERTVARVAGRTHVFAGIGDDHPAEILAGNDYLRAGVDAVVARPPIQMPPEAMLPWFRTLLDGLTGPLLLYNMPLTTKTSIPLDAVAALLEHPRLVGIKDSENNLPRLTELIHRFGGRPGFSIFVGVGALMEQGLKLGADGIVPSVGNLIPEVCQQLCEAARVADWPQAKLLVTRMNAVAAVYQKGRTLNESLAALKWAMHCRGMCSPEVLPPLPSLPSTQRENLRTEMERLQLLNSLP